jgi:hypothetical protein
MPANRNSRSLLTMAVFLLLLNLVAQFGAGCPAAAVMEDYTNPGRLISIAAVPSVEEGKFLLLRAFEDGSVEAKEFRDNYQLTLYRWTRLVEPGE